MFFLSLYFLFVYFVNKSVHLQQERRISVKITNLAMTAMAIGLMHRFLSSNQFTQIGIQL